MLGITPSCQTVHVRCGREGATVDETSRECARSNHAVSASAHDVILIHDSGHLTLSLNIPRGKLFVETTPTDLDHFGDVGRGAGEVAESSGTPPLQRDLNPLSHGQGNDGGHRAGLHDAFLVSRKGEGGGGRKCVFSLRVCGEPLASALAVSLACAAISFSRCCVKISAV